MREGSLASNEKAASAGLPGLALRPLLALSRNPWDVVLLPLAIAAMFLFVWGTGRMAAPYAPGAALAVSLDPALLPYYALRTSLRMGIALAVSLVFTFAYASWAAKSERAGRILVPLLDIAQSVPILGFLSITLVGFIRLFPGSLLGPEAAAIFAIFTSQAWNMTFSFYASLRQIPAELYQVAAAFRLSAWQRFWRLELPFALPNLIWNAMMSVAGGWFFVVAAEAIQVEGYDIELPGVGSCIAAAIRERDLGAIGWALATMLAVILLADQLVFRPLVAWSERFRLESVAGAAPPRSWLLDALHRSRLAGLASRALAACWEVSLKLARRLPERRAPRRVRWQLWVRRREREAGRLLSRYGTVAAAVLAAAATVALMRFVRTEVGYAEIGEVFALGAATGLRVAVLTVAACLFWIPVGVWIGLRPRLAQRVQPVIVFFAAFPANLLFPFAVLLILRWRLEPEIWLSPLMILGTQWYILFNVIAGTMAIPGDLAEAARSLQLRGLRLWKRLWLPAVFPSCVTGALTAAGGAWNASVVAEVVSWGSTTITATGLGAYIAAQTAAGDHPRIVLGVSVMSLYVVVLNRALWERLYAVARRRFTLLS
ncbi:MAG: ABC transporter permease subunit [Rhodocyclaceae bacterium]